MSISKFDNWQLFRYGQQNLLRKPRSFTSRPKYSYTRRCCFLSLTKSGPALQKCLGLLCFSYIHSFLIHSDIQVVDCGKMWMFKHFQWCWKQHHQKKDDMSSLTKQGSDEPLKRIQIEASTFLKRNLPTLSQLYTMSLFNTLGLNSDFMPVSHCLSVTIFRNRRLIASDCFAYCCIDFLKAVLLSILLQVQFW